MSSPLDRDDHHPQPFLMRFLRPLPSSTRPIVYDRSVHLNVLAGENIPAVRAGFDLKTVGAVAED